MTNNQPTGTPAGPCTFTPATQRGLSQSAHHAHGIAGALIPLLHEKPGDDRAHEIQSSIQSLYGGVLRLAACPHVTPRSIVALSRHLGQFAGAGGSDAVVKQAGAQIKQALCGIAKRAGLFDDGAMFALHHATHFATRLQTGEMRAGKGAALPALLLETAALSQRLASVQQQLPSQDPVIGMLFRGMAGMLHGVVARVPPGPARIRMLPAMREVANAIDDASMGAGRFETAPHPHLGKQMAGQVHALYSAVASTSALRAEVNEGVLSLEADAAALITAVDARLTRFGLLFQS